jgi:serine/threonine protein kinase
VLIDHDDQPHVTDFGLAKRLDTDSDLTLSGQVLGSPNYMSPEQASGKRGQVSRASDVYSLGAILFHLLTGRPPFVAESVNDTIQLVLEREPITPRVLVMGIPKDLETICLKCLQKEPGKRYPTARELAEELERFLDDKPIQARRTGQVEKLWRWCRRHPAIASLASSTTALLLTVSVGSPIAVYRISRERESVQERELEARLNLYASDLNIVQQALESGDTRKARDLLNYYVPNRHEDDLRGFEWRYLWRLQRGNSIRSIDTGRTNIRAAVAFSKDGRTLVIAGTSNLQLWDVPLGRWIPPLEGHQQPVRALAFSPDGRMLASEDDESKIIIWDFEARKALARFHGRDSASTHASPDGDHPVAFFPDGRTLATS